MTSPEETTPPIETTFTNPTQEIKRVGGWRGVTRSAFIRSLIRAAMQRTPLNMEGVTSEEELAERLGANNSFPKG